MADELERTRPQKQAYLANEIINGGYDPNDFKEFLDNIKDDGGSNIDLWTLDELYQVVNDYKNALIQREQEKNNIWQSNDIWKPANDFKEQAQEKFDFDFQGFENKFKKSAVEGTKKAIKEDFNFKEDFETQVTKAAIKGTKHAVKETYNDFKFEEKKTTQQTSQPAPEKKKPTEYPKPQEFEPKKPEKVPKKEQKIEKEPEIKAEKKSPTGIQEESIPEDLSRGRASTTGRPSAGDDETFYSEKKCVKSGMTELSKTKDISILISGTEIVKGGLLTSSYLVYVVTVKPLGWTVRRRFDDFGWLRSYLCKQYPYMIVPPITTKAKLKKPDADMIKRRMAFFEKFLTNLLEYPEVLGNKIFEGFLRIEDPKQFKELKKEGDKAKKPHGLSDLTKVDGKLILKTGPELTDHAQKTTDMITSANAIYAKMRLLAKELQTQFDKVSDTVFNLGECFTQLYNNTAAFNTSVAVGASKELENVYLTVNNMMVSWGGQLVGQIKIVQDGLENFFKYSDFEGDAIKDIIKVRQGLHNEYYKHKKAVDAKIDKQKASAKEIQQLEELRDVYAFYSNETFEQITHALQIKCKHYTRNFVRFASNQTKNLQELFNHWSESVAHLSGKKNPNQKAGAIMDRAQFRPEEKALDVDED